MADFKGTEEEIRGILSPINQILNVSKTTISKNSSTAFPIHQQ